MNGGDVYTGSFSGSGGSGSGGTPTTTPSGTTTTPFVVTLTNPLANAVVSGTTTVAATVSDGVAVTDVQFFVDTTSIDTATTSYATIWDTTSVANGTHSIVAVGKDTLGRFATSTITITVDNGGVSTTTTPLTIAVTDPLDGATVSSTTVPLAAVVSDSIAVTGVQFFIDTTPIGTLLTTSYTTTWDSTSVTNGTHTLTAVATDAADNHATSTITVDVENTSSGGGTIAPLTVTITTPVDGAVVSGSTLGIIATTSDSVAVTSVQFKIDSVNVGTPLTTTYATTWDTTSVANGSHTIAAIALDSLGRYATSTATVDVENGTITSSLSISFVNPNNNATVSGAAVPLVAAVTHTATIVAVQFLLDDPEPLGIGVPVVDNYTVNLDTTGIPNGQHELLAVTQDVLGEWATSTIMVDVENGRVCIGTCPVTPTVPSGGGGVISGPLSVGYTNSGSASSTASSSTPPLLGVGSTTPSEVVSPVASSTSATSSLATTTPAPTAKTGTVTTPGAPNTGAGGERTANMLFLVISIVLGSGGGIYVVRSRSVQTDLV